MEARSLEAIDLAKRIVDAASDRLAVDIILLDIRQIAFFADYFVILSGTSERHMQALEEGIGEALKKDGIRPLHIEGAPDSGWILLDCRDVVVHIFSPEIRDFYQLERVWSEATIVLRVQ